MKRVAWLAVAAILTAGAYGAMTAGTAEANRGVDLQAVYEIEQTMYTYAYELDSGTADGLRTVFADRAVAEYSFPGGDFVLDGADAIIDFLGPFAGTGGAHIMGDPLIEPHGNRADGRFYLWRVQPPEVDCPADGTLGYLLGEYNVEFRRIKGEWKIWHLVYTTQTEGTLDGCAFVG
jgi:hypothetical protein